MIDKENSGYAGRIILLVASTVSAELKTYSSWMLGAFGASISLLVTNIDKVDKYICHDAIA